MVRYLYLNFNFEAIAEFVFDVLSCPEAFENTSFDHYSHLSAQEFGFVHQM